MTDASDRPADGSGPRPAPDPVPDVVAGGDEPDAAAALAAAGEPMDGEALPPPDAVPAEDEVGGAGAVPAAGLGAGGDDPGSGAEAAAATGDAGAAAGGGGGPRAPMDDLAAGPEGAGPGDAAPDELVEAGGALGSPEPEEAVAPAGPAAAAEGTGAGAGVTAPPEEQAGGPGDGGPSPELVEAGGLLGPPGDAAGGGEPRGEPPVGVAERAPDVPAAEGAAAPGAEAASGAEPSEPPQPAAPGQGAVGHPPALPPPPPELAEVPTDAGRIVSGRVREVRGDDVVVDLDDGRTGVINRRNLGLEGEPAAALSPGDPIEGAVLARSDPQHRVVLSRTWALKKRAWEAVAAAAAEGRNLTGSVVSVGQKGIVVDVGVRGFVPASHLELGPVADLQAYAGQQLELRVLDVDVERERLVLSRRSLLLKEQRRSVHDVLSALQPGEVRRGRVTSLSDYGAFVDIGGVNGLVHLSELSWTRVRHPSEVVAVGQEVDVKVLDVKVKKRRVSLSVRQLSEDPLGSLTPGEIRTGPVKRLVDFGAFVDLDGVEGLVHLSELAEYRVSAPEEIVAPGEQVRVKVLSVDRRRRRVELSIRQAAEYGG